MVQAVIFDLDGTLVATDRYWPDAARAGALRAFKDLGWDRDLPDGSVWMGMVGQPLEEAFEAAFPELAAADRKHLLDCCVEEEHRLLDEGRAGLLPGVTETLKQLDGMGVPLGVASNCSQGYLDALLGGLGISKWIREARCLDSPGISNKAGMIADLLHTFGTRHGGGSGKGIGMRPGPTACPMCISIGDMPSGESPCRRRRPLPGSTVCQRSWFDGRGPSITCFPSWRSPEAPPPSEYWGGAVQVCGTWPGMWLLCSRQRDGRCTFLMDMAGCVILVRSLSRIQVIPWLRSARPWI